MTRLPPPPPASPPVRLGALVDDGIAPSVFALVERGAGRHPLLAARLRGEVELRFTEGFAPVRVVFEPDGILVEDGPAHHPDLMIAGRLPDIVHLTTAPMLAGAPNPFARRGRAALARIASGRVKMTGNRGLARNLLQLLRV